MGSKEFTTDKLGEFVSACAQMVSPPLIGMQRKIWPYASLLFYDTISKEQGYIAGVTNPMCIQNANNYDVCCQVDSGKIKLPTKAMCEEMKAYEQSSYFKLD